MTYHVDNEHLTKALETPAVMDVWFQLNLKQQRFFTAWLNNGFRAAEAYASAYGVFDRTVAASAAGRLLATKKMKTMREAIQEAQYLPVERAHQVQVDALESDDERIRLQAAKVIQERAKVLGVSPRDVINADNVQINNYTYNPGDLPGLLNMEDG